MTSIASFNWRLPGSFGQSATPLTLPSQAHVPAQKARPLRREVNCSSSGFPPPENWLLRLDSNQLGRIAFECGFHVRRQHSRHELGAAEQPADRSCHRTRDSWEMRDHQQLFVRVPQHDRLAVRPGDWRPAADRRRDHDRKQLSRRLYFDSAAADPIGYSAKKVNGPVVLHAQIWAGTGPITFFVELLNEKDYIVKKTSFQYVAGVVSSAEAGQGGFARDLGSTTRVLIRLPKEVWS